VSRSVARDGGCVVTRRSGGHGGGSHATGESVASATRWAVPRLVNRGARTATGRATAPLSGRSRCRYRSATTTASGGRRQSVVEGIRHTVDTPPITLRGYPQVGGGSIVRRGMRRPSTTALDETPEILGVGTRLYRPLDAPATVGFERRRELMASPSVDGVGRVRRGTGGLAPARAGGNAEDVSVENPA
jgi:hypothetical protein